MKVPYDAPIKEKEGIGELLKGRREKRGVSRESYRRGSSFSIRKSPSWNGKQKKDSIRREGDERRKSPVGSQ